MTDPIRPTDDAARALARRLLTGARHGALGTVEADTGLPLVTRVAVGAEGPDALLLVSTLSAHARALQTNPAAALLLGDPGPQGDPLTHPRLTLQGHCVAADKAALRDYWLADHPKSLLYYDFTDFHLLRLVVAAAQLNGGHSRADLAPMTAVPGTGAA